MSPAAGAIVVLGCRVLPSGEPSGTLARRVRAAARAFHGGIAPRVIAAGGRRWCGHAEAQAIAAELVRAGVPREAIVLELCSLSTTENAVYAAAAMRAIGAGRAFVATSSWHMPRALADFRAAGVVAEALEVDRDPPRVGLRGAFDRAYLLVHEAICRALDLRAMRRTDVLRESAAWFAAPMSFAEIAPRRGGSGDLSP